MTQSRRLVSTLMIVSGLALCGAAALHYVRGYRAQDEGRRAWDEQTATPGSRPADENPGIVTVSRRPSSTAAGAPVARIRIPSAKIDYVVFEGTDNATLEKGPGHVPGTQLPGAPEGPKNCVITGHRDSHFRRLGWVQKGHTIELDEPGGKKEEFRVVSRRVVEPTAIEVLAPTRDSRLTLITCYPFNYIGPAPRRFVIVAERVS